MRLPRRFVDAARQAGAMGTGTPSAATALAPAGHPQLDPAGDPQIDAVFTWVDGADPAWRRQFEYWSARTPDSTGLDGRHPARYREHGELRFALRSVWTFAPWIRRLHVVTAGGRPEWLGDHPRLAVVGHEAILDADCLPTFNSHAIEARLHHLPDLAEHFVYFNDDMFFGRPQQPGRYVGGDGRIRIQLAAEALPDATTSTGATVDLGALGLLRAEAPPLQLRDRRPGHGPMMNRRAHLFELEHRFREALRATAASRFRSASDIPLPTFLAPVDALATGRAVPADLVVGYVGLDDSDLQQRLESFGAPSAVDAFCLNDTERVPADATALRRHVDEFLRTSFPEAAPWEIGTAASRPTAVVTTVG